MSDRRTGTDRRAEYRDTSERRGGGRRRTPDRDELDRQHPAAQCRECGGDSGVIRTTETDGPIVRRRECLTCGHRWNTREWPDEDEATATSGVPAT